MMEDMEKKLMFLLATSPCISLAGTYGTYARAARDLINNGVTVQRWIPVTERLPEVGADILVCHKNGFVATNAWLGTHWWFKDDKNTITHWMPLPEPPKEGE